MAPAKPPCVVCNEIEGKYKCPRCQSLTCSLGCSKSHREEHPTSEDVDNTRPSAEFRSSSAEANTKSKRTPLGPGEEPAPPSLFPGLTDMPEYAMLMSRYPKLNDLLLDIARATDPPPPSIPGMPGSKGASANGGGKKPGGGGGKDKEPWTREKGLMNGVDALRQARTLPGDTSEGAREFCELVKLYRVQRAEETRQRALSGAVDVSGRKEDAAAIRELIRVETAD